MAENKMGRGVELALNVDGFARLIEKKILPANEKRGACHIATFAIIGASIPLFLDQAIFDQLVQGMDYEVKGSLTERDGLRLLNPIFNRVEVK